MVLARQLHADSLAKTSKNTVKRKTGLSVVAFFISTERLKGGVLTSRGGGEFANYNFSSDLTEAGFLLLKEIKCLQQHLLASSLRFKALCQFWVKERM